MSFFHTADNLKNSRIQHWFLFSLRPSVKFELYCQFLFYLPFFFSSEKVTSDIILFLIFILKDLKVLYILYPDIMTHYVIKWYFY